MKKKIVIKTTKIGLHYRAIIGHVAMLSLCLAHLQRPRGAFSTGSRLSIRQQFQTTSPLKLLGQW